MLSRIMASDLGTMMFPVTWSGYLTLTMGNHISHMECLDPVQTLLLSKWRRVGRLLSRCRRVGRLLRRWRRVGRLLSRCTRVGRLLSRWRRVGRLWSRWRRVGRLLRVNGGSCTRKKSRLTLELSQRGGGIKAQSKV